MLQRIAGPASVCLVALVATAVVFDSAGGAVTQGKSRPAETKYLMRGVVQPNCAAIGKILKEGAPADDKAWDTLACHASLLNEMGHVLMDDGRCPDKAWAEANKTLKEESAKVLAAAKAKNAEEAQTAFKAMTGACAACHKAHKK